MKDNDCTGEIDETFVLGELEYAVYFSSDTALTATLLFGGGYVKTRRERPWKAG